MRIRSTRMLRRVVAAVLLLGLLGGCASTIELVPVVDAQTQLLPGHGFVVVQIADTTPTGSWLPVTQLTLAPKDVAESDENKYPRLSVASVPGETTRFFYGQLPANDYSISSLRSFHWVGDTSYSRFYPAGIELGTFAVEPGKVTDLGTLIIHLRRRGEDYGFATVRAPGGERGRALLVDTVPALAGAAQSAIGWDEDGKTVAREDAYISAVGRQVVFGVPWFSDATGELIYPAPLGVLVDRDAQRNWAMDAYEEDIQIRFIGKLGADESAAQVLVTEFNEILYRPAGGEWISGGASPPAVEPITYIGAHRLLGVFAVTSSGDRTDIWAADAIGEQWHRIGQLQEQIGLAEALFSTPSLLEQSTPGGDVLMVGDGLVLVHKRNIFRFDFATRSLTNLDSSNADSIQRRNGVITVKSGKVSFDDGASWSTWKGKLVRKYTEAEQKQHERDPYRRPSPRTVKILGHPIFRDSENGIGIHERKGDDGKPYLVETSNGGRTWRATDVELPEGCYILAIANDREMLVRCFLSGEFYRSDDAGRTWLLEREVSDT